MVDSVLFPLSGRVIVDANGDPVSGAKLEVFDAGTSNQQTVYTDSGLTTAGTNPIETNASGVVPVRYVGTAAYKVTFENSSGDALTNYNTWDNVKAALDTSSFLTGTVEPSRSIINKTTAYTTVAGDLGKQINANATGGSFTVTLLSAVTAGDGGSFVIKHSGTAGEVTVAATGGQTIDGQTNFILQPGDSITVNSDGADYHVQSAHNEGSGIVVLTYAASITPDFQYPGGTDYQLTLTGDATINSPSNLRVGTRGTFTFIQDGTGGREITPNSIFTGDVQLDQTASAVTKVGFHVRSSSNIDWWVENKPFTLVGVLEHQEAQNTNAGTATLGSWEDRTINTTVLDTVGITLASNAFTLPPGTYWIEWMAPAIQTNKHQTRLFDVDGAAAVGHGMLSGDTAVDNALSCGGVGVTITADNSYKLQSQVSATKATVGYGGAGNFATEVYLRIKIYAR